MSHSLWLLVGLLIAQQSVAFGDQIWDDSVVPAVLSDGDTNAVELGLKFQSLTDGYVRGIRFYKGPANTGTHVGNLWSANGTLLTSMTFTNESASGWQQQGVPVPVAINADTTYVISYHAPFGGASVDEFYFESGGVENPPLRALASGESFGDSFNRADSSVLGANWTEASGDAALSGNQLRLNTASYGSHAIVYTGTASLTAEQYVKVSFTGAANSFPAVILRYTDAASPFYVIYLNHEAGRLEWARTANAASQPVTFANSSSTTVTATDTWGITIEGTGNGTIVRAWRNPAADAPTSSSSWGGDSTPDVTFTDDPGSPVDSGSYVGLAGEQISAGDIQFDSFSGGDANDGNGVYSPGASSFPVYGYNAANFWVDLVFTTNSRPVLSNPIANQSGTYGTAFNFTFAANIFTDWGTLSYSASGMPPGITFDGATRTFSGAPMVLGAFPVEVVAHADGSPTLTATNTFTITVGPAPLTIAAQPQTKVYGATDPALTYTVSGWQGSDTEATVLTGALTRVAGEAVGSYAISQGTLAANANYTLSFTGNTLAIVAKQVSPVIVANDKTYDGNTTASLSSQTLTGVIAPDVVALEVSAASYDTKNVGTGKTVTATGLSLGGADAGNYVLGAATATDLADITAKPLTLVGLTADSKIYDGTATATISNFGSLTGAVLGDDVTLNTSSAAAAFADRHVGVGKTVTVSSLALNGADAGNYSIANQTTTADITAKALTLVGLTAQNKTYDGTATATISNLGLLTGVVLGDNVTLNTSSAAAAFADRSVGVGKTVTLSSLALDGADAGNYSIANQTTTADITAKGVAVTGLIAANKVYDGNTTATITSYGTLTGVVPGDGVTLNTSGVTAAFADKDVGAGKTVTVSGLALSGADAGNYSLTQPAALADITARSASVTANDRPKIYGETVTFAGTEFSTSGFVSGDVVTSVTLTSAGAAAAVNVDNYAIVPSAAVGTGLANYVISYVNGTLAVGKATLTATADDQSRAQGVPNPTFTISYAGFVNGDDVADLDSLPTASTTATVASDPGTYAITLTGGSDNNYAFTLVNGTLTVTSPLPPVITSISVDAGVAVVTWTSATGLEYKLQYKENVTDADWVDKPGTILATESTASATDAIGSAPQRFYRVVQVTVF